MDQHVNVLDEYRRVSNDITKLGREKRELEAKKKALESQLMKTMRNSTVATINGQVAFTIEETVRRSASVSAIENVAPELYDKLVKINKSTKIKVADV